MNLTSPKDLNQKYFFDQICCNANLENPNPELWDQNSLGAKKQGAKIPGEKIPAA